MLPEGWRTVPIGSVVLQSQYGLNLAVAANGTTPIIGMKDMVAGRIQNSGWGSVSLNEGEKARYLLRPGDILLNRTNSPDLVGKVAVWDRIEEAVFPSYIVRFKIDEEQACPAYVNLVLNTVDGQSRLRQISTRGVSQANINPTTFQSAYVVTLPPLPEQRRIAAVLDAWDTAIATADRLVQVKHAQLARIAETLLAPAFHPRSDEWAEYRLGDLFDEREECGGDGRLLSVTAEQGIIDRDDVGRKDTSNADKSLYKRIQPGDIGYNTMRMWQGVSALSKLSGLISPAYTVVVARPPVSAEFAAHLFKQPPMIHRFWRYSQGLVDDTLNLKFPHFAQVKVCVPSLKRQAAIASALSTAKDHVAAVDRLRKRLSRQKHGLMQLLLTGKLRVPESIDALLLPAPELVAAA